ncbi:MAG: glycoside hydrolase family 5 protein [Candidatus Omnitrophica bacterium]|nr:glycoside hydrolase family 5 protein [Candidatus Omnitrophota bacterium]
MFLRVEKGKIIAKNAKGISKPVMLKGVNLGGWLMMEGYILGGRNIPEREFKNNLALKHGRTALLEFNRLFRDNFILERDFKLISKSGFNCVRIPFNFRLIQARETFRYLEKAVDLCRKHGLFAILDLHSAPGSQNEDWHSDSLGEALLWKDKRCQEQLIGIWQFLAQRFKHEKTIAGYDILNEAVCANNRVVSGLYKKVIKAIREIDRNHIIFLEGNNWAQDIEFLGEPCDENMVYSIHFYMPLEFTFNFIRNIRYPGKIGNTHFPKAKLKEKLRKYYLIQRKYKVPIFVGEFGQNSRCPYCHKELTWLKDTLSLFREFGFHWTYWTWKAIAQGIYPDGIYQYQENPAWVNRQGPAYGWETYYYLWHKNKKQISDSWRSENFRQNKALSSVLGSFLR